LSSEPECFGIKLVRSPCLPVIWRQRVSRSLLISGEPNDAVLGSIFGADRGNQPRVSRDPRLCDVQDAAADEDRLASVCAHRRWKYHCLSVHRMWSDPRPQSTTGWARRAALGPRANSPAIERDDFSSNRHPALSFCLSMISGQTLRVVPRENRYPLFRIMRYCRCRSTCGLSCNTALSSEVCTSIFPL
jgi:hypothetical protein